MLGFDPRAARVTWTAGLVLIAFALAWLVRHTLFVFVLALSFAYMVWPLVQRLAAWLPRRWPITVSTALVFGVLVLALAGLGSWIGPKVAEQSANLVEQLPKLTEGANVLDRLPLPGWLATYRLKINQFVSEHAKEGTEYAMPVARQIGRGLFALASNVIYVVLIPVLAFLLIKEGPAMRDRFLAFTDRQRHAPMWRGIVDDLDTLLGGYMRALLLLALATIVVYSVVFSFAGVPFSLLLAAMAGALEFVPVLGPLAAAVLVGAVGGLSGYDHVLAILGFIVLYRVFQDYVLNPYLMSEGVTVEPIWVLFGLIAGEEIAGVTGVFLSVPVLAAAKILIERVSQERRRGAEPSS